MKTQTLLFLLLVSVATCASGPSGRAPTATPALAGEGALLVTELVKCEVTEVREDGTIIVRDLGTGRDAPPHALAYSKKTAFKAQDKKQFGKKKISAADLRPGHRLLVTKVAESGEIQRVKVLKDKTT